MYCFCTVCRIVYIFADRRLVGRARAAPLHLRPRARGLFPPPAGTYLTVGGRVSDSASKKHQADVSLSSLTGSYWSSSSSASREGSVAGDGVVAYA